MSGRFMTMMAIGIVLMLLLWWKAWDVEGKRSAAIGAGSATADAGPSLP